MQRYVYRPPRGNRTATWVITILGGLFCAFFVFYFIPLLKRLEAAMAPPTEPPAEEVELVLQPDEYVEPEETPPDEPEEEPEPELAEESSDLDISLDLPDLGAGTGGTVIEIAPKFNMSDSMEDIFASDDLDQAPKASTRFPPRYPDKLKKAKKQGRVLVSATVDEKGYVTETSIKESSGYPTMDEAAQKALRKWKFKPGRKSGQKVKSRIVQPISFKLNNA